jgi:thiamine-monophosphate kinase
MLLVSDIGEQGLLQRLQRFCPADLIGDDAALLTVPAGQQLVVTTDVLVDGVHFSDRTTPPHAVGWRAAAANLSDLAAMGATPIGLTIGLGLPQTATVEWVEQVYRGLSDCLAPHQAAIVGGDLVKSPVPTLSITALGMAKPEQVIRRAAAQVGWAIVSTGSHGGSRAGLELLLKPELGQELSTGDRQALIQLHQYPQPRLDVLPHLFAAVAEPIAGMDSSDGLADAVLQLCRASGVGAQIERSRIPMPPAFQRWQRPNSQSHPAPLDWALDWALYGGEDFQLVLGLPLAAAAKFIERIGGGAAMIGVTTADPAVWLVDSSGVIPPQELHLDQGFQHF